MISKEKLERYQKYNGDLDLWVKSQKDGMDELLNGTEWTLIDKIIQRLKIEKGGNASMDYRGETVRVLNKNFENEEVILFAKTMI